MPKQIVGLTFENSQAFDHHLLRLCHIFRSRIRESSSVNSISAWEETVAKKEKLEQSEFLGLGDHHVKKQQDFLRFGDHHAKKQWEFLGIGDLVLPSIAFWHQVFPDFRPADRSLSDNIAEAKL